MPIAPTTTVAVVTVSEEVPQKVGWLLLLLGLGGIAALGVAFASRGKT